MEELSEAGNEFKALPRNKKLAVGGILVFVFLFGLLGAVLMWKGRTVKEAPSSQAPSKLPAKQKKKPVVAALSLVPASQSLKKGDTFLVTVNFKTGDNKVDTVDAVLTYDPEKLKVEEISEGMFFAEYPVKKAEKGKIILTGTIGFEDKQKGGVKGEGALGTIKFKALKQGVSRVDFDEGSLVAVNGKNVLEETKEASFEIY